MTPLNTSTDSNNNFSIINNYYAQFYTTPNSSNPKRVYKSSLKLTPIDSEIP